ncbi:MAG: hypothetical protein EXQ87_06365 [Alphaproteobacteria bacterium]|nr:hypothetical protein [Alphaproteobacteria bacterium]
MFGWSLQKILFLILAVIAVLLLARWLTRARGQVPVPRRSKRDRDATIELVRNPKTGAYEPRDGPP